MKKTLLVLGLAGAMLVPTQQAQAIIGVGLNLGQDSYTFESQTYEDLFLVSGVNFTRQEMAKPIGGGLYLFIDLIPIVDLELGGNIFFNKFDVTYLNPTTGQDLSEEFGWARTAGYFTIQRKLFKVPMFNVFAGGGLSFHATVPVLDKEFMEEFIGGVDETLDITKLEDEIINKTGFHIEFGARFKPVLIPFAVNVKYRLAFVEGIVPGEKSFSTISAGFGFQF